MTNTTFRQSQRGRKAEKAELALSELLAAALRPGYFGAATLTLSLQDGHIQHVKITTEKMIK